MGKRKKPPMKIAWRQARPDDPMFGQLHVAAIRFCLPDDDDPIFSSDVNVSFPARPKPAAQAAKQADASEEFPPPTDEEIARTKEAG